MLKHLKKIVRLVLLIVFLFVMFLVFLDMVIQFGSKSRMYNSVDNLPKNKVGLLLGTSKYLSKGVVNQFYANRIDAAFKLFNSGYIEYILVSGDNRVKYYDEPTTIKNDLVKRGIPESKIIWDYAGFRTLDSVVRSKEIFGQTSITIISQRFHVERAIFIAKRKGIDAIGYLAKDVPFLYGLKTRIREHFARIKMMLDLIVGKQPYFLGEKIEIS